MPCCTRVCFARSAAYPCAMPFRVNAMPGFCSAMPASPIATCCQPMRSRTWARSPGLGRRPSRWAWAYSSHRGCTVGSNCPPLCCATSSAVRSTVRNSGLGLSRYPWRLSVASSLRSLKRLMDASTRRMAATAASRPASSWRAFSWAARRLRVVPRPSNRRWRHCRRGASARSAVKPTAVPIPVLRNCRRCIVGLHPWGHSGVTCWVRLAHARAAPESPCPCAFPARVVCTRSLRCRLQRIPGTESTRCSRCSLAA